MRLAECLRQTVQFELWSVVSPYLGYIHFFSPSRPTKGKCQRVFCCLEERKSINNNNKEPAHGSTGTRVICVFFVLFLSALIVGQLSSERKAYNLTTFLISCPAVTQLIKNSSLEHLATSCTHSFDNALCKVLLFAESLSVHMIPWPHHIWVTS